MTHICTYHDSSPFSYHCWCLFFESSTFVVKKCEKILLGGWTNPSQKYDRQNGFIFPNFGVTIKNIWNHHLIMTHIFVPTMAPLLSPTIADAFCVVKMRRKFQLRCNLAALHNISIAAKMLKNQFRLSGADHLGSVTILPTIGNPWKPQRTP